jgi:hypothetical protein
VGEGGVGRGSSLQHSAVVQRDREREREWSCLYMYSSRDQGEAKMTLRLAKSHAMKMYLVLN